MYIAQAIGIPLKIDPNTLSQKYDYYVRVLVEVDLSTELPTTRECSNFCFPIEVYYENLPSKYSEYGVLGHISAKCKHDLNSDLFKGWTKPMDTFTKIYRPKQRAQVLSPIQEESADGNPNKQPTTSVYAILEILMNYPKDLNLVVDILMMDLFPVSGKETNKSIRKTDKTNVSQHMASLVNSDENFNDQFQINLNAPAKGTNIEKALSTSQPQDRSQKGHPSKKDIKSPASSSSNN